MAEFQQTRKNAKCHFDGNSTSQILLIPSLRHFVSISSTPNDRMGQTLGGAWLGTGFIQDAQVDCIRVFITCISGSNTHKIYIFGYLICNFFSNEISDIT